MRAGELRFPLQLQEPVETADGLSAAYVDRGTWWASMDAREGGNQGGVIPEAEHELRGRWRPDVTSRWRASFEGRVLRFRSALPSPDRRTLVILATETVGARAASFTRTTQVEDPVTGAVTPTITTITGTAVQTPGDPERYKALNLVPTAAPTLFFTPDVHGALPQVGDAITWGGMPYVVRDVDPVAPSGFGESARVVISR